MAIDDKIRDEKLKFDINRWTLSFENGRYHSEMGVIPNGRYHLEKLIKMNILQVKKYCHLIKEE